MKLFLVAIFGIISVILDLLLTKLWNRLSIIFFISS